MYNPLVNPAVTGKYEPGSQFKSLLAISLKLSMHRLSRYSNNRTIKEKL